MSKKSQIAGKKPKHQHPNDLTSSQSEVAVAKTSKLPKPSKAEPALVTPLVIAQPAVSNLPATSPVINLAELQHTEPSTNVTSVKEPLSRFRGIPARMVIGFVLLSVLIGLQVTSTNNNSAIGSETDTSTALLIAEVSKRAILPRTEKPSVTTVVNESKLNQSFLQNARQGDKVLLYFQAGKAFVYRPSSQQIVNIGPLSQPTAKVFLRNGTSAALVPVSIREKLGQTSDYVITSQDAANNRLYRQTLVIDIVGNRPDIARRIAGQVGGTVSQLPQGETRPDADFLIIAGADSL